MPHRLQPRRIQRSRKRGYRTPEGTIYVGRPTLWGNPFDARRFGHARSVILYREWLNGDLPPRTLSLMGFGEHEIMALDRWRTRVLARIHELEGKNLQCWCPLTSRWCHGNVLIVRANPRIFQEAA